MLVVQFLQEYINTRVATLAKEKDMKQVCKRCQSDLGLCQTWD